MRIADETLAGLKVAAKEVSRHAYSPYSNFRVGAAVLTEQGRIFSGCNVENASYGLAICAERSAIFQAVASGERSVQAVAIYTPTEKPVSPCGACRQVMNEFGPETEVYSFCDGPEVFSDNLSHLLPSAFGPHNL
jgi:cytidine deaminase